MEDHYIAPTRWQDFAFQAIFWTAILLLLFAAFRLIRFALKPQIIVTSQSQVRVDSN
jgi:hypothetical protein